MRPLSHLGREQRVPHLVKYSKADGQTGNHEVEELHEAIAYVERLRNDEGIDAARIYRIEEVQFEFRPYFRVELGGAPVAPVASVPPVATSPSPPSSLATSSGSPMAFTPPSPRLSGATASPGADAAVATAEEAPPAPAWTPPVEPTDETAAVETPADAEADQPANDLPSVPAAALLGDIEPRPMVDPWADAPPPPAQSAEPAATSSSSSNGRRGLFGR